MARPLSALPAEFESFPSIPDKLTPSRPKSDFYSVYPTPPSLNSSASPAQRSLHSILTRALSTPQVADIASVRRVPQQSQDRTMEKETVRLSPEIVHHSPGRYVYDAFKTPPESPASGSSDDDVGSYGSFLWRVVRMGGARSQVTERPVEVAKQRARHFPRGRVRVSTVIPHSSVATAVQSSISGAEPVLRERQKIAADDPPLLRSTMRQRASCPGPFKASDRSETTSKENNVSCLPSPSATSSLSCRAWSDTDSTDPSEFTLIITSPSSTSPLPSPIRPLRINPDLLFVQPRGMYWTNYAEDEDDNEVEDEGESENESEEWITLESPAADATTDDPSTIPTCEYTGTGKSWADMMEEEDELNEPSSSIAGRETTHSLHVPTAPSAERTTADDLRNKPVPQVMSGLTFIAAYVSLHQPQQQQEQEDKKGAAEKTEKGRPQAITSLDIAMRRIAGRRMMSVLLRATGKRQATLNSDVDSRQGEKGDCSE